MGSRPSHFTLTSPGPLRLYSTAELLSMPAPRWLIDGIIPEGGLIGLYGQSGTKKTFIAMDVALCVATGHTWKGHDVQSGYVVYISAEGNAGIGKRALAWLVEHEITEDVPRIAWLLEGVPVNADSDQMVKLMTRIADEIHTKPTLIVIDTLARCFDGDENAQEDMGRFVAGADWLRAEFQCAVLVVHHTRLGGDRERGNTVFRAATDTMIAVEVEDHAIKVSCNKQKDAEEFKEFELELKPVSGTDSCVVIENSKVVNHQDKINELIEALRRIEPAKWDDWMKATGLDNSQFMRYYAGIRRRGLVAKGEGGLWRVRGLSELGIQNP